MPVSIVIDGIALDVLVVSVKFPKDSFIFFLAFSVSRCKVAGTSFLAR